MTQLANQPRGTPLTGAMVRAQTRSAPTARPELPSLLTRAAEALCRVLSTYTQAPLRADADGIAIMRREIPIPESKPLRLASSAGVLSIWLLADRRFSMGICEAGFGGSGTEEPYEAEERPLSRTERRLTEAVLNDLSLALPELLSACFECPFVLADEQQGKTLATPPATSDVIVLRILVSIFGYSGEITLVVPEAEIAAITAKLSDQGGGGGLQPEIRQRYAQRMMESVIMLTAQFPQELLPLRDVINLRKGQTIALKTCAQSPVILSAEGKTLFHALLQPDDDSMRLEIIDT